MPNANSYYYGGNFEDTGNPLNSSVTPSTKLQNYYGSHEKDRPAHRQVDPYMEQWAQQSGQNQLNDRAQLQDAYSMYSKQAAGGITPQQTAMNQGFAANAQAQQNLASGAQGGAYARSAAQGALTQNAGIQGAVAGQQLGVQKANDQIFATQQMQKIAAMQRGLDLQGTSLTAEDAQRKAQLDAHARGMNNDLGLGYAGLEGDAIGMNWDAYKQVHGRGLDARQKLDEQKQKYIAAGTQAGGAIAGGVWSDTRAKKEAAFGEGVKAGLQANTESQFNASDYTPMASIAGQGASYKHNATGAIVGVDNRGNPFTMQNGPDRSYIDPRDASPQLPHNEVLASKNRMMENRLNTIGAKSLASGESEPSEKLSAKNLQAWMKRDPMGQREIDGAVSPYAGIQRPTEMPTPDRKLDSGGMESALTQSHIDSVPSFAHFKASKPAPKNEVTIAPVEITGAYDPQSLGGAGIPSENLAMMQQQVDHANGLGPGMSDERAKQRAFQKGMAWQASAGGDNQNAVGALSQIEDMQPIDRFGIATRKMQLGDTEGARQYALEALKSAPYSDKNPSGLKPAEIAELQKLTQQQPARSEDRTVPPQSSPNAMAPKDARIGSDAFLKALRESQSQFRYKNEPNSAPPRLGVMAQDVEKVPGVGPSIVKDDQRTGLKYIDGPAGLSAAFAGLGRVDERLASLEKKPGRR